MRQHGRSTSFRASYAGVRRYCLSPVLMAAIQTNIASHHFTYSSATHRHGNSRRPAYNGIMNPLIMISSPIKPRNRITRRSKRRRVALFISLNLVMALFTLSLYEFSQPPLQFQDATLVLIVRARTRYSPCCVNPQAFAPGRKHCHSYRRVTITKLKVSLCSCR